MNKNIFNGIPPERGGHMTSWKSFFFFWEPEFGCTWTYTWKGTVWICKPLKPNWKFYITRANNILDLEVLKPLTVLVRDDQKHDPVDDESSDKQGEHFINKYLKLSWKTKLLYNSSVLQNQNITLDCKLISRRVPPQPRLGLTYWVSQK